MKEFYQKYQAYLPAAFFVGGFLFDLLTTDRIDQSFSLMQQAGYLALILLFIYWEVITPRVFQKPDSFLSKVWSFHVEVLHFLFGSLLSLYTIFYFKSASLITSIYFMVFLTALLIINELPIFQKQGIRIRAMLLALCLSSYFIYLVPVMTGAIGWGPFLLAMVISMGLFGLLATRLLKAKADPKVISAQILVPGLLVQLVFVLLYFFKLLPPVPVSLKFIGVYHHVEAKQGQYLLNYEREWWRFWQSGAQTFVKREGDRVFCFASVFSPTQFKDRIRLDWYHKETPGWTLKDSIALPIVGGRDQGYRGYAYKSHFDLGEWQVRVKTSDDREVGRITFEVVRPSKPDREWRQDLY